MKQILKKIATLLAICLLLSLIGCQDEAPEIEQQSFTLKSGSGGNKLTEQETADAIAMYNFQMTKATRPINFTFDNEDLVFFEDQYGKRQYTFMVHHPDDSERVFHNVIITDWDGSKKTMLVKYEMTEEFVTRFNSGSADFPDFDGNVTYILLTADEGNPCGETPGTPIPINGGDGPGDDGGGAGSSYDPTDPGQPWDPNGNGNPHNQGEVEIRFLMMGIEYLSSQFNAPLYGHRTPRDFSISHYSTSLSVIPPLDDTANPCGEGDEIMILLPIPIASHQDLCNELKAKSQNPNFQSKMNSLTSKAGTQNFETAYALYQNNTMGLRLSNQFDGTQAVPEVQVNVVNATAAQSPIGFMHCHLDDGSTFKIFSLDDIIALGLITSISTSSTAEFVVYVTTGSGTFALKINDLTAFQNITMMLSTARNTYQRDYLNNVKMSDSINDQVTGFLNFLNTRVGPSLSLYQQDTNGDWKKLELDSQGIIISTNC